MPDLSEHVGLSKKFSAAEAFETYMQSRLVSVEGFSKVKAPNGKSIAEVLNEESKKESKEESKEEVKQEPDHNNIVKKAIRDALAPSDDINKARDIFNETITKINTSIEAKDIFHAYTVIDNLSEETSHASEAIKKQFEAEKKALVNKFKEQEFKDSLTASSLGLTDDQVSRLEKDMVAALEKSQKEQLSAFNKSTQAALNSMHQEAAAEGQNKKTIKHKIQHDKEFWDNVTRILVKKAQENGQPPNISLGQQTESEQLEGIKIKELGTFKTAAGQRVTYSEGDNSFTIQLPNRFFSPIYYRFGKARLKEDLKTIAEAVKASGFDSITMTVRHNDNKHAMELAREAVLAARNTGFDEKKITIQVTVDGKFKKMSATEILNSSNSLRKAADVGAERYKQQLGDEKKVGTDPYSINAFKEKLKIGRDADAQSESKEEKEPTEADSLDLS